jgi:hypothetical protein
VQSYPVRPSHRRNLDPAALAEIARSHFEAVTTDGATVTARWGAIDRLSARGEQRALVVELAMNPKVPEAVAAETIARYNRFLEEATGFGAKERARRLRKSAQAGSGGD